MSNVRGKKMKITEGRIEEDVKSDEIPSKYTTVSFNVWRLNDKAWYFDFK